MNVSLDWFKSTFIHVRAVYSQLAFGLLIATLLSACGGNSGGGSSISPVVTATGQFKDSNTEGISYVSGAQSGVTDALGTFIYEVGNSITFSVGGVVLGTTEGKSIITPVDLVPDGDLDSPEVINIVSFLLTLDADRDASNGISISEAVREMANSWPQIDFSGPGTPGGYFTATDLPDELINIFSDLVSIDGLLREVPGFLDARNHLENTLLCSYSGVFTGTYSGDESGNFGFVVDPSIGLVNGLVFNETLQEIQRVGIGSLLSASSEPISAMQSVPIDVDGDGTFVSGHFGIFAGSPFSADAISLQDVTLGLRVDPTLHSFDFFGPRLIITGPNFSGRISSLDQMSGTWEKEGLSGSFVGNRIGGALDAEFRYSAFIRGANSALLAFDTSIAEEIRGVIYNLRTGASIEFSSMLEDGQFTAALPDGSLITGVVDRVAGLVHGSLMDGNNQANDSFFGTGCKLN